MKFVEDAGLKFCMTISKGIDRNALLDILGKVQILPVPRAFDDVSWPVTPGKNGLLNVFEEGDFIITLENSGLLGVSLRTIKKIIPITREGVSHYSSIYQAIGARADEYLHQYVDIQDGKVTANFDPMVDDPPEAIDRFFPEGTSTMQGMIDAIEYWMDIVVREKWLSQPTDTYVIDYDTGRY